ncbi:MAG: BTAD domain-containing putative transcriptional regulator [Oscillospiraceae bacterium]
MEYERNLIMDQIKLAVILSETETHEVIYLNSVAAERYGLSKTPSGFISYELLGLDGADLDWYLNATLSRDVSRFQPIFLDGRFGFDVVLDSTYTMYCGRLVRYDAINVQDSIENFDYISYADVFSSTVERLEHIYKGVDQLEQNIDDVLDAVLYTYAADRAFIYEVDSELSCAVDIYERCRTGYESKNDKYKSLYPQTVELLLARLEVGESYSIVTNKEKDDFNRTRLEDANVWLNMAAPFSKRSGIKCFLCVDNPRRFFGHTSFLQHASSLLATDMYTNKMSDHLAASQLLNKLNGDISDDNVKIYLLGRFELLTSMGVQTGSGFSSSQCCTLFIYLLSNRKRVVSVREIAEALWPDQLLDNPYNMVKSVVFRTRKALDGICAKPLIIAANGTYMINPELNIWLDTEEFEKLCRQAASATLPDEARLRLYKQAMSIYRGGMLPSFEAEMWLLARISYYQLLYIDMVNGYIECLNELGDYQAMFSVVAQATVIEPGEPEIHLKLIEALMKKGRYELAKKYFSKAEQYFTPQQKLHFRQLWAERS